MLFLQLLLLILGPRVLIAYYYFFTPWFSSLFEGILVPVLGFLLLPFTLLAYAVISHWFPEVTNFQRTIIMVLAIILDVFIWTSER